MEAHRSERLAIYADDESCAVFRKDSSEALTGEHAGQPLSRERLIPGVSGLRQAPLRFMRVDRAF